MDKFETTSSKASSLQDRMDIQDLVCAVSLSADLGDIDRAASFFSEAATLNYASLWGKDAEAVHAKSFWAGVKEYFGGFDAAQHQVTNFVIRVTGDSATCTSAVRATLRVDDKIWVTGGFYHHQLAREAGCWKIAHLKYDHCFQEGVPLAQEARARLAARKAGLPITRL